MAPPFEEAEEETTAVVQEEARGRGGTATTVLKSWQNKFYYENKILKESSSIGYISMSQKYE